MQSRQTMKKTLKEIIIALSTAAALSIPMSNVCYGECAIKEVPRGKIQIGETTAFSRYKKENSPSIDVIAESLNLTYSGKEKNIGRADKCINLGAFGFLTSQYISIRQESLHIEGFGDLTLGVGPKGNFPIDGVGNLYFAAYAAGVFPIGEKEVSSNRFDEKFGAYATLLKEKVNFSIAIEQTFSGRSGNGINAPNSFYAGAFAGFSLPHNISTSVGVFSEVIRDDFKLGASGSVKYTISKLSFETKIDKTVYNDNKTNLFDITTANVILRYSF